jgi:hypothetical protein
VLLPSADPTRNPAASAVPSCLIVLDNVAKGRDKFIIGALNACGSLLYDAKKGVILTMPLDMILAEYD